MVVWWVVALIYIGLTIGYELLRPKQEFDEPTPGGLGDFRFPTIGEGRAIPIVWGTCKIEGPMVTWYGDLDIKAITKKVKTGLFSSEDVTVGYKYYLGLQLVLASGVIDELVSIEFDGKVPNWSQSQLGDHVRVTVDSPGLFGGEESEGGVQGNIDFYTGTRTQGANDYLETAVNDSLPGWRGISHMIFRRFYVGTSPYIKTVAAIVRRCPNKLGLTDNDHNINGDANPACMIHDLLTSPVADNGLGVPEGLLDLQSFRDVGATLADEGLGLSILQQRKQKAKDLVLEILRHIDGIIYVEPSTGLLVLRLVRFDYTAGELPVLDSNNCTVKSFSRPSWSELKNTVRATYIDRDAGFIERTAQAQDLAAIEVNGGEVSVHELQLRGLTTAANAQQAVARGLIGLGYPLAATVIEADRTAWAFRPGTVFKLNWPPLGISGLVCRVSRIKGGNLGSGKIELDAMEDIFAVDWTAYSAPPATGWTDPITDVPALTDWACLCAPYEAVKLYGSGGEDVELAVVMAARGQPGISTGYRVWVKVYLGTGWHPPTTIDFFTPSGTLNAAIDEKSTSIVIDLGPDIEDVESVGDPDFAKGVNVLWIQQAGSGLDEFIAFKTVTADNGTITLTDLARGCLDTAPTAFNAGTRVWFISYRSGVVNVPAPAVSPENLLRFQPFNNQSEYAFGSSFDRNLSTPNDPARWQQVYCPTDLRFNGLSYPDEISGELTVSFEHRNRLASWSYSDSGKKDTPETGTQYRIKVYGELGTLVHTENTTDKTWTYLEADEIAESGLGRLNNHLRITVETFDVNLNEAWRMLEWEFDRT